MVVFFCCVFVVVFVVFVIWLMVIFSLLFVFFVLFEGCLYWMLYVGDIRVKGGKDKVGWGELLVVVF